MNDSTELVKAYTERTLTIWGDRTYRIPPPSTRTAFAVLAYMESEHERDAKTLRRVCADWLPLRPYSVLFSNNVSQEERANTLTGLLFAGLPTSVMERFKKAAEEREEPQEEPTPFSSEFWIDQITAFQARVGGAWGQILEEPWTVFLSRVLRLDMLDAQAAKDVADGNIIVRADDDGEAYDQLAARAAGRDADPAQDEDPDMPDWQKTKEGREEWYQKKRAELYRVQQAMTSRSPDELPRN